MPNESYYNRKLRSILRKNHVRVFQIVGSAETQPGTPDTLIFHKDLYNSHLWIEGKSGNNTLTKIQYSVCYDLIYTHNANVLVARYRGSGTNLVIHLETIEGKLIKECQWDNLWETILNGYGYQF